MKRRNRFSMGGFIAAAVVAIAMTSGAGSLTAQVINWNPPCATATVVNRTPCTIGICPNWIPALVPPCTPFIPPGGAVVIPTPGPRRLGGFFGLSGILYPLQPIPFIPPVPAVAWVPNITVGPAGCCVDIYVDPASCTITVFPSTAPPPCRP